MAAALKDEGNKLFQAGEWKKAADAYSRGSGPKASTLIKEYVYSLGSLTTAALELRGKD